MDNNCFNCKFEPDWGETVGKEYPRRTGTCKWDKPFQTLPGCFDDPRKKGITIYSDNSGVIRGCKTWEPK